MKYQSSIVIDNGSLSCKAGMSGQDAPRTIMPSVVGVNKSPQSTIGFSLKQKYIGQEALNKKDLLQLRYPIKNGIVTDWQDYSKILHDCFANQLRVNPSEHNIMITQAARNPKINGQNIMQIIFQQYSAPGFCLANPSLLALYEAGRTSGIVLDIGEGVVQAVPILSYEILHEAVERYNFGGNQLTQYMCKLLNEVGQYYETSGDMVTVRQIKQKLCYVAQNFENQCKAAKDKNKFQKKYQLPDKKLIKIDSQRFRCPQILFNPMMIYRQIPGIHQIVIDSISKCKSSLHQILSNNIILAGGGSVIEGLPDRFSKQIKSIALEGTSPKIVVQPERKYMSWIGGSIVTSMSTFKNKWITKEQFQQNGAEILYRKRF